MHAPSLSASAPPGAPTSSYRWIVIAVVLGAAIGHWAPSVGTQLRPAGDAFVALIRMLIGPIVFCTVVLGIGGAGDLKKAGRVGAKALLYFELMSTLALLVGWAVVRWIRPGDGYHVQASTLDGASVAKYTQSAQEQHGIALFLSVIPKTFADAFTANGSLLQVLFIALLFGVALSDFGMKAAPVVQATEAISRVFLRMLELVMKLAPLGACAAMAYTVGAFGVHSLWQMARLVGSFYLASALFVLVPLAMVARLAGFSIFRFLRYIREELLLVLGTSSSESALVPLMAKLERAGCSKGVVGLVVPTGYSFNLDGTNIYLTMAALFVAQALDVELSLGQQLALVGVAMLTSKGAAGVTGSGFITLASTLAVVPSIPVAGLTLLLGVDRFMSEARALTNMIGNGVACIVVSAWEGELNREALRRELDGGAQHQ